MSKYRRTKRPSNDVRSLPNPLVDEASDKESNRLARVQDMPSFFRRDEVHGYLDTLELLASFPEATKGVLAAVCDHMRGDVR